MNVLELKPMEFAALTNAQRAMIRIELEGQAGLHDLEALKRRVAEYVHLNTLESMPTSLARINRMYGRTAAVLGTSARELCRALLGNETLDVFEGKRRAYVSRVAWQDIQQDILPMLGAAPGTPEYDAVLKEWDKNTR